MRLIRKGFTLIEVTLVLAISGIVFIAVAVGTGTAVRRQRYLDTVQDFMEFFRGVYSSVSSVQSDGTGQSDYAIYGKLVTFGEEDAEGRIYVYDIIGDVTSGDNIVNRTTSGSLGFVNANVLRLTPTAGNQCKAVAINQSSYRLKWDAWLEKAGKDSDGVPLDGSVMIARSPFSGTIFTYYLPETAEVQKLLDIAAVACTENPLSDITGGSYAGVEEADIDFCIASHDQNGLGRRNVRLRVGRRNATAVELIDLDSEDNQCGS